MPEYPGGTAKLMKYLSNNLIYPKGDSACYYHKIWVGFIVDENGNVINPTARFTETGSCVKTQEFTKSIEELFIQMPKWKPGSLEGKKVKVRFNLPISIHMN
ncbi:MAG: energy transducer TonB [Bacteroidota bacterium]|nr:energy transducer TonB [Bacteroidota bacterium]